MTRRKLLYLGLIFLVLFFLILIYRPSQPAPIDEEVYHTNPTTQEAIIKSTTQAESIPNEQSKSSQENKTVSIVECKEPDEQYNNDLYDDETLSKKLRDNPSFASQVTYAISNSQSEESTSSISLLKEQLVGSENDHLVNFLIFSLCLDNSEQEVCSKQLMQEILDTDLNNAALWMLYSIYMAKTGNTEEVANALQQSIGASNYNSY